MTSSRSPNAAVTNSEPVERCGFDIQLHTVLGNNQIHTTAHGRVCGLASHHNIAEPCPLGCANKAVVCKKWVEWPDWRAIRADINASITPENL